MIAPVVVGIDDIEHGGHAMELAAHEAELRGAPLWIGHAYQWVPPVAAGITAGADTAEGAVRDLATGMLAEAVRQVQSGHPDLEIHSYAMSGRAAPELAALAGDAALLVLGRRGRGGFPGALLGSVVLRALGHARCPVLVADGPVLKTNRVLAGVDVADSASGPGLLGFAFDEAGLRGAALTVLHVWEDPGRIYPDPVGDYTREHLAALSNDHAQRLDKILAHWRGRHPGVAVDARVWGGSPARLLVEASQTADLLVIGARPHDDGKGLRLGALAHTVLRHAQCPVAIVPDR